jgi:hypothetical protein
MTVEDLVGVRVWMKTDQFRSVPGVISNVVKAVNADDLPSSIAGSIFKVDLPSGHVIDVPGSDLSTFDHIGQVQDNGGDA